MQMNQGGSTWIFWLLGAIFIGFGIYSRIRLRRLAESEHTVSGTIVRYEELPDTGMERGSTGMKYYPVVRFDTSTGRIEAVSRTGTSMRGEEVGTSVDLHYDPEDPARFELLGGKESMRHQMMPIALGAAFLVIGTVLLF
ncbi:hypothetical protein B9G55_05015 [Saccharibacillus sp. O16]|nr:hypothetical protein B9G55_05015 [Saccharibacillus sp. O16]